MSTDLKDILKHQPIVLFDGECGFCNKSVRFFLKHEAKNKYMHFAALKSDVGKALKNYFEMDETTDSIVLIKNHSAYIKSCAVLRIATYMKWPWPLAVIFVIIPPFIRNWAYDMIARRRKKIAGKIENCALLVNEDRKRFLDA